MTIEQELFGGNSSGRVVRIGDTVRKRWFRSTPFVHHFMDALRDEGVAVPHVYDMDEQEREVIEFIEGPIAQDVELSHDDLAKIGAMVRQLHDAAARVNVPAGQVDVLLPPPDVANLLCHNDLGPWNLILGEPWTFIDWDSSGPSNRLWDLAYAASAFALNDPSAPVADAAARLAAFVDGYDASAELRAALPDKLAERTGAMYTLLETSHADGTEPWATMFVEGHGDHWRDVTSYIAANRDAWAAALAPNMY